MRIHLAKSVAWLLVALLVSCATERGGESAGAAAAERQPSDFDNVVLDLSEPNPGFLRNGMFIPVREIAAVTPGMGREQLRGLLGAPVSESSPRWWFYNVNLPLEGLDDYLVCQYRVSFNGEQISAANWRRPQCQARYDLLLANMVRSEEPPVRQQSLTISSDVLFAYKSAMLSTAGERELDDAAAVMRQEVDLVRVDIEGHADRIGSDAYNMDLSERRARAVGAYLAAQGVPPAMIFIEGKGSHEPVVFCDGTVVNDELKRCLQPNRRVEITINALR